MTAYRLVCPILLRVIDVLTGRKPGRCARFRRRHARRPLGSQRAAARAGGARIELLGGSGSVAKALGNGTASVHHLLAVQCRRLAG